METILQDELGDKRIRVAQCGLAGENLVRYACVINDVHHAAGRTGMGAVMGSKKLRAIAVRGTGQVELADRDKVRHMASWLRDNQQQWKRSQEHGTGGFLPSLNDSGGLPTCNFQGGSFELEFGQNSLT